MENNVLLCLIGGNVSR